MIDSQQCGSDAGAVAGGFLVCFPQCLTPNSAMIKAFLHFSFFDLIFPPSVLILLITFS